MSKERPQIPNSVFSFLLLFRQKVRERTSCTMADRRRRMVILVCDFLPKLFLLFTSSWATSVVTWAYFRGFSGRCLLAWTRKHDDNYSRRSERQVYVTTNAYSDTIGPSRLAGIWQNVGIRYSSVLLTQRRTRRNFNNSYDEGAFYMLM